LKLFTASDVSITMKAILCLASLLATTGLSRAHEPVYGSNVGSCQMAAATYLAPVVYQALAVYQGPVNYFGPVFYVTPPAGFDVSFPACDEDYVAPSTVMVIGNGPPRFYSNCDLLNCWYPQSTVVRIGSEYARPH
jgi:hypothetical protein